MKDFQIHSKKVTGIFSYKEKKRYPLSPDKIKNTDRAGGPWATELAPLTEDFFKIGQSDLGTVGINHKKLFTERMLVSGTTGSGKSFSARNILEEASKYGQLIIFDKEGEYISLRESIDIIIFGKESDIEITKNNAEEFTKKILHEKCHVVFDVSDYESEDSLEIVSIVVNTLLGALRYLWSPILVFIDEAHNFAPAVRAQSKPCLISLQNLARRGRKRLISSFFSTQRLGELNNQITSQCGDNLIIGKTTDKNGLAIVTNYLGLRQSRNDLAIIRNLKHEFLVWGKIFNHDGIIKYKSSIPKSRHPVAGSPAKYIYPNNKIRKIIKELKTENLDFFIKKFFNSKYNLNLDDLDIEITNTFLANPEDFLNQKNIVRITDNENDKSDADIPHENEVVSLNLDVSDDPDTTDDERSQPANTDVCTDIPTNLIDTLMTKITKLESELNSLKKKETQDMPGNVVPLVSKVEFEKPAHPLLSDIENQFKDNLNLMMKKGKDNDNDEISSSQNEDDDLDDDEVEDDDFADDFMDEEDDDFDDEDDEEEANYDYILDLSLEERVFFAFSQFKKLSFVDLALLCCVNPNEDFNDENLSDFRLLLGELRDEGELRIDGDIIDYSVIFDNDISRAPDDDVEIFSSDILSYWEDQLEFEDEQEIFSFLCTQDEHVSYQEISDNCDLELDIIKESISDLKSMQLCKQDKNEDVILNQIFRF